MALTITKFAATPERLVYLIEGFDPMNPAIVSNAQLLADTVPGPLRDFINTTIIDPSPAAALNFFTNIQLASSPAGGPVSVAPSFSVQARPDGGGMSGKIAIYAHNKVPTPMGEGDANLIFQIQYVHSIIR